VFKTIELGAWYRIRWEGKSVFGQVLQRHRNSYTFRYADAKGKVRTGKVKPARTLLLTFHKAGCKGAATISAKNLVRYNTREGEIAAGKKPCSELNP